MDIPLEQSLNRLFRKGARMPIIVTLISNKEMEAIILTKTEMVPCARCAGWSKREETRHLHDGRSYCARCYQNETNIFKMVGTWPK